MTLDFFIVSFPRDYEWLDYCLRSIRKFVSGYRRIYVALPSSGPKPRCSLTGCTLIPEVPMRVGYVGQQITKMRAYRYSNADYIAFVDSDHFCKEPVDLQAEYLDNGLPLVRCRPWAELQDPSWCRWRPLCEDALGFECPWFALELLPNVWHRDTLQSCCDQIEKLHGMSLEDYADKLSVGFSEFIALGNYALKYEPTRYVKAPPPSKFYFHGHAPYHGMPQRYKDDFDRILK
jgi:hypothetical protein